MLPSQDLFRSFPCPFFLAGLCDRPHCSYRHCRSDVRIDRKIESEKVDDIEPEDLREEIIVSKSSASGLQTIKSEKAALESESSLAIETTSEITISALNSSPSLKAVDNKDIINNNNRKDHKKRRLSETPSLEQTKKRRVSIDREKEKEMGVLSSSIQGLATACNAIKESCFPSPKEPPPLEDVDDIVRRIEGTDKKDPKTSERSGNHSKIKKDKPHNSRKDRDKHHRSSSGSSKESSIKDRKDSSKRSENKEKDSRHKNRDDRQSRSDHRHDKRKDESSNYSRPKDHRRKSSRSADTKNRSSSSVNSPKRDRHQSGSSSGKGSGYSIKTSPGTASINISNRFKALEENSPDEESAYNSDIFEDTPSSSDLHFNWGCDSDEDDPDMIEQECLAMFENYKPEPSISSSESSKTVVEKKTELPDDGFNVVVKKRVAHTNAINKTPAVSSGLTPVIQKKPPPTTTKSLQDQLFKRFETQRPAGVKASTQNGSGYSSYTPPQKPAGKARIAHVPNAGKLAQKPILNSSGTMPPPISNATPGQPNSLTYSQTVSKGGIREAHKPSQAILSKPAPLILRDAINKSSKIPHNTRQHIMGKLFDEHLRIFNDYQLAFDTSVQQENELLGKCTSKQVYYSKGSSMISGLRKVNNGNNASNANRVVSHQEILNGNLDSKNCSVLSGRKEVSIPVGCGLYKALLRYVMNEQQLQENGYPRPTEEKGRVTAKPRLGDDSHRMTLTTRICDRCKKTYRTTEEGDHIIPEICNYHWGRRFNMSSKGGRGMREANYICCGSDDSKIGCATAPCHVSKSPIPLSSQKGFVTSVNEAEDIDGMGQRSWDVIGVDCEMVYTTHGNELARVTVVGANLDVLYDMIVKPTHRVLDCNTRFSGLTSEDIDKATQTIVQVQAVLLANIRKNTIIIGHSLESDLIALRLCHDTVIDTSVLYPHRMGPPQKRALKTLSSEILKKVIQDSDAGHDSAEDARIALELVLAKLKSDMASK